MSKEQPIDWLDLSLKKQAGSLRQERQAINKSGLLTGVRACNLRTAKDEVLTIMLYYEFKAAWSRDVDRWIWEAEKKEFTEHEKNMARLIRILGSLNKSEHLRKLEEIASTLLYTKERAVKRKKQAKKSNESSKKGIFFTLTDKVYTGLALESWKNLENLIQELREEFNTLKKNYSTEKGRRPHGTEEFIAVYKLVNVVRKYCEVSETASYKRVSSLLIEWRKWRGNPIAVDAVRKIYTAMRLEKNE